MKIYKKIKHDKDITKYLPDYPEKKIPSRVYLCNILNTVYPNSIPLLVKKLKKLKVVERNAKMKKFVLVRKKFAASLRSFESKSFRSRESWKIRRTDARRSQEESKEERFLP